MAQVPCKYFQQGGCRNGDKCFFSHAQGANSTEGALKRPRDAEATFSSKRPRVTTDDQPKFREKSHHEKKWKIAPNMTNDQILEIAGERKSLTWYNELIAENGKRKNPQLALALFEQLKSQGLEPNIWTYNTLINALVRAEDVDTALKIYNELKLHMQPNVVTMTTLLKAYTDVHPQVEAALNILQEMKTLNIAPNIRTYTTLFRMCVRVGDLQTAQELQKEMEGLNIALEAAATQCLALLYAQHFRLDESLNCLKQVQACTSWTIQPTVYLLVAMVAALSQKPKICQDLLSNLTLPLSDPHQNHELKMINEFMEKTKGARPNQGIWKASNIVFTETADKKRISSKKWTNNLKTVNMEICCGDGEWIVQMALNEPQTNWVAIESRFDRVFHTWALAELNRLQNMVILCGDAENVLHHFARKKSLNHIYVNFPNPPVPGTTGLFTKWFIHYAHKSGQPGATLTVLTDDGPYAEATKKSLAEAKSRSKGTNLFQEISGEFDKSNWVTSVFDTRMAEKGRTDRFFVRYTVI